MYDFPSLPSFHSSYYLFISLLHSSFYFVFPFFFVSSFSFLSFLYPLCLYYFLFRSCSLSISLSLSLFLLNYLLPLSSFSLSPIFRSFSPPSPSSQFLTFLPFSFLIPCLVFPSSSFLCVSISSIFVFTFFFVLSVSLLLLLLLKLLLLLLLLIYISMLSTTFHYSLGQYQAGNTTIILPIRLLLFVLPLYSFSSSCTILFLIQIVSVVKLYQTALMGTLGYVAVWDPLYL